MITQIALQFFLQLILPAIFISELFKKSYASKIVWAIKILFIGLGLCFIFLTARWDLTSYYLRWIILLLFPLGAWISYRNITPKVVKRTKGFYIFHGLLIVGCIWLNLKAFNGYFYSKPAVDLSFPLKNGVYYIGGGGASRWLNNHAVFPPQDYALDILKLNALGNRAWGIWPKNLNNYTIFGDSLFSPCDGHITKVVDGFSDQTPPKQDTTHLAGNHLIISCKNVDILLAHLKQNSITVSENRKINDGQFFGQVGNSGNTIQPHLHIHTVRGGNSYKILDGEGVPITFDGRFFVRNNLVWKTE